MIGARAGHSKRRPACARWEDMVGSRRRMMMVGTLGLVIVLGSGAIPTRTSQAPAQLAGRDWQKFGPKEKEAYLAGFIAGAAAVHGSAGAVSSDTMPSKAIDEMRAAKALPFPYSISVYASQIDDYYWYQNHLDVPIVDALVRTNLQLRSR
jgi:hypothetical protein